MSKNFVPGSGFMDKGFTDVFIRKGTTVLERPASVTAAETMLYGTEAQFTISVDTVFLTANDGQYLSINTPSNEFVIWFDKDDSGTQESAVKAANPNANKFIRVGFTDSETVAVTAAAIKNAVNGNDFAKQEMIASVATDTVTLDLLYGGATDGVDAGTAASCTATEVVAGVGDFTKVTQTAEGQSISSEDGTSVNSGQGEVINLTDILTTGFNAMNFSGDNHTYCVNTYNKQKCQVVMYAKDSFKKTFDTTTVTMNVKKVTVDGSRQETQFAASQESANALANNPIWDLNVDGE